MVHGSAHLIYVASVPQSSPHKEQFPSHHPVENYPQAPDTNLGAVIGLELQDLWGHMGDGTTEGMQFMV